MSLEASVRGSLEARQAPDARDTAAAELALLYARTIDAAPANPDVLGRLGPKLFTVLASLGLTLEARGTKAPPEESRDQPAAAPPDPIDELEQRRALRGAAR